MVVWFCCLGDFWWVVAIEREMRDQNRNELFVILLMIAIMISDDSDCGTGIWITHSEVEI